MNLVYTAKYKLNATDRFHGELPNKRIFGIVTVWWCRLVHADSKWARAGKNRMREVGSSSISTALSYLVCVPQRLVIQPRGRAGVVFLYLVWFVLFCFNRRTNWISGWAWQSVLTVSVYVWVARGGCVSSVLIFNFLSDPLLGSQSIVPVEPDNTYYHFTQV